MGPDGTFTYFFDAETGNIPSVLSFRFLFSVFGLRFSAADISKISRSLPTLVSGPSRSLTTEHQPLTTSH